MCVEFLDSRRWHNNNCIILRYFIQEIVIAWAAMNKAMECNPITNKIMVNNSAELACQPVIGEKIEQQFKFGRHFFYFLQLPDYYTLIALSSFYYAIGSTKWNEQNCHAVYI